MDGNRLRDLGPLAGLNLHFLSITGNQIKDLRPLRDVGGWDELAPDGELRLFTGQFRVKKPAANNNERKEKCRSR